MPEMVVSINEYKYKRMYDQNGNACLNVNLSLDAAKSNNRKDIRKEMISGYMRMLSNLHNNSVK